ncbi:MAG: fatty acid kinase fatty acid binding subunit [Thermotogaceae bacterium]|jgi:DegV family protein with EDD domain|nr:fatty acid kinase fatty acid binding subunit [Thermotogaceae bacterium]MDN5337078.1 fatty acid kinase fatty acid binding subunit [Thermotogaceae bacterium]
MEKVKIIADSTADIPKSIAEKYKISIAPLKVVWPDGREENDSWNPEEIEDFYKRISEAEALPKTSQPSPADFEKLYEEAIKEGYEKIVVLCISSKLSGTYNSSLLASKSFDTPIHVVDTKLASAALGLITIKTAELFEKGFGYDEVIKIIDEDVEKRRFYAAFYVSNFDFLVKGGRVSKIQGFIGGMLKLKIGLIIDEEGGLTPFGKARGSKKALEMIKSKINELIPKGSKLRLMPVSAAASKEAEEIAHVLSEDYSIATMQTALMGKVITTHVGPGTAGTAIEVIEWSK